MGGLRWHFGLHFRLHGLGLHHQPYSTFPETQEVWESFGDTR